MQELNLGSRVHACKDGGIPHWFLLSNTNTDTFYRFPNVFYSLRKFELSVSIFDQVEEFTSVTPSTQLHSKHFKGEHLANLLGLARNLEDIKLIGDSKATRLCDTNTLMNHKWARLRVFYLKGFEASASELEDFLKRHTLSLQRMTLDDFHLTSGSLEDFGTMVSTITPALEFILGLVWIRNRWRSVEARLPLEVSDLDVSGPSHSWYDKAKRVNGSGDESRAEDEDEDESGDESSSEDELAYSSDDSSPETQEEPRRKPDLYLLETTDEELRIEVEHLQSELPGCLV